MQLRDLGRTVLLCIIGGGADAISFLRFGTFVGAMTGNTVLIGIDLAERRFDNAGYHLGVVAAFLAAIVVTQALLKARIPTGPALIMTALMLGGSAFIDGRWGAALAAAALGAQNAAVRTIGGVSVNTAFVTGDLLRLGAAVPEAAAPKQHAALIVLATAWIAYATGAVAGALAQHLIDHPMIVPAVLALAAAIVETCAARRGQA